MLVIDVAVALLVVAAARVEDGGVDAAVLLRTGLVLACATLHLLLTREHEERRRGADRQREHVDQTSVWIVTAAVTLPVVTVVAVIAFVRAQRYLIARKPPHTFLFTTAAITAGAVGVHALATASPLGALAAGARLPDDDVGAAATLLGAVVAVIAVYFTAQAVLVGGARGLITARWSLTDLLGSGRDNRFILVTLLLGLGAVAVQALHPLLLAGMVPLVVHTTREREALEEANADKQRLQGDALRDPGTGLLNRRGFNPAAQLELYGDQLADRRSALLLLDLDHFKRINDTYGHLAGDEVLAALAGMLRTSTREGDLVCRWGGEEFVVLLPATAADEAAEIAERIRHTVAVSTVTVTQAAGGRDVALNPERRDGHGLTISIGLALAPEHGGELAELCRAADEAAYAAKHGGRNQVVTAEAARPPVLDGTAAAEPTPVAENATVAEVAEDVVTG